MNMNFELLQVQTQKLIMTQQLQLAIKMLQLPAIELNAYIQQQLEDNPVLDSGGLLKKQDEHRIDWKKVAKDYDQNDDYYESYNEDDENISPLNFVSNVITLKDHLLMQLHLTVNDELYIKIGEYLIENIDSAGYLRIDSYDVSQRFKTAQSTVEDIIKTIQSFDPPGIGARTLEECLIIQLMQQDQLTDMLETVIKGYLKEVSENKYNVIAHELSITPKEAQALGDIIKGLEPKPGSGFADSCDIKYIVPDVLIEKIGGKYVVTVNDSNTPKLSINSYYRSLLKSDVKDDNTLEYVKKKLDSAAWLIKSIEQRKNTIYNVVNSITKFQAEFLDKGMNYLKPLTLKDVAEDIKVHESTVSRAVHGKYVQTPRGLYALKFFFTRGIDALSGGNISSGSVKESIKNIVAAEDDKKPLSDQKITDILNKQGVNISRRTVTKYRCEMNIPAASARKRF